VTSRTKRWNGAFWNGNRNRYKFIWFDQFKNTYLHQ
jgi:hypothetical protein